MTPKVPYTDLVPRYWFARALWWVWSPSKLRPWPAPQLQQAVTDAREQLADILMLLRQAEAQLEWALDEHRRARQALADAATGFVQANETVAQAEQSARPRFEEHDPAGRAFRDATQAWEQAQEAERKLSVQMADFDRAHSTPEREDLFARGYGTEGYEGGTLQRWRDKKLGSQTDFDHYARQRGGLTASLAKAAEATRAAHLAMEAARLPADTAWKAHGHTFLDRGAIEQAQKLQEHARQTHAQAVLRQQAAEAASTQAHQHFTDALVILHQKGGPMLWGIGLLASQFAVPERLTPDRQLAVHGDIDRGCFVKSPHPTLDQERRMRMQKATQWFMGQEQPFELAEGYPNWMALAYGNAHDLPDAQLIQASLNLPDPPSQPA